MLSLFSLLPVGRGEGPDEAIQKKAMRVASVGVEVPCPQAWRQRGKAIVTLPPIEDIFVPQNRSQLKTAPAGTRPPHKQRVRNIATQLKDAESNFAKATSTRVPLVKIRKPEPPWLTCLVERVTTVCSRELSCSCRRHFQCWTLRSRKKQVFTHRSTALRALVGWAARDRLNV